MHNKYLRERSHHRRMRDGRYREGHPRYMETPEVEKRFIGYHGGEPAQYGYSHSNRMDYESYDSRRGRMSRDYDDYRDYRDYRDYGDYRRSEDYDYGYGRNYDYGEDEDEREYKEGLHHFIERLKRQDKFNLSKEQVISHAKSMGVKFDRYDEDEFYATYLMMISDYKDMGNEPAFFVKMAKKFLEDEDSERQGSEKLCAYLYEVVMPSQK